MPWLPFALLASFLIAMGSGARSGFKTQADIAEEERKRLEAAKATGPSVQGRRMKRWVV